MPAMMCTPPLATPRSIDAVAPNSKRRLDDLHAGGVELQVEEAAAAEDADREQERMRPLGDVEVERRPAVEERQRQRRAQAHVLQREHADGQRRQREREAGADARRRDVEARARRRKIGRDGVADLLDELQVAGELQRHGRVELDRDVGLLPAPGVEAELRELDPTTSGR